MRDHDRRIAEHRVKAVRLELTEQVVGIYFEVLNANNLHEAFVSEMRRLVSESARHEWGYGTEVVFDHEGVFVEHIDGRQKLFENPVKTATRDPNNNS